MTDHLAKCSNGDIVTIISTPHHAGHPLDAVTDPNAHTFFLAPPRAELLYDDKSAELTDPATGLRYILIQP